MTANMPWFRMYSECVDDEKLRLLAFEDRWHFVAILCCKASGIIDEAGPLLRRKVAVKLGLDTAALDEAIRRLSEVELIDKETLQPLAWARRQFKSDDSTERVRAYRERMKRDGNVSETAQETDTDTDTDTEEKKESARSPRGSRLPSGFPTPECLDWCKQERPDLDVLSLRDKFRDYWLAVPGARGRKLDWPATWRNFVRSEFAKPRDGPRRSAATESGLALAGMNRKSEVVDVTPTVVASLGR